MSALSFPFIPDTAKKIWKMLGLDSSKLEHTALNNYLLISPFEDNKELPEPEPLFQKIDNKQIAAEKKKLEETAAAPSKEKQKPAAVIPAIRKAVDFKEFSKMDMRIGKVLEAEKVQGSQKLLKLKVDIGIEQRQIVAGIAKFYEPESLIGKLIVVMANLEPKSLMGLESQGMVMAAGPAENIVLLTLDGDIEPGTRVS